MRIVSLHPAATDLVHLLDLDQALVGVSADSDWPAELVARTPVLNTVAIDTSAMTSRQIDEAARQGHSGGSLYHVDPDLLRVARPDLILTQDVCEVCAVSRRDVELVTATLGYQPTVLSLNPATLDQVLEDIDTVASAADVRDRGSVLAQQLRTRLAAVGERTAGLSRQRVLCMEWLDPPYTAGHWVPEMVHIAGGSDELGQAGGYSRQIEWRDIVDYQPQVLVLIPCSLELEQVAAEFPSLTRRVGWSQLPAVKTGQVYAANTQLFSRSGPRLIDGVEVLARLLHPLTFTNPLTPGQALRVSADGQRLEPYA